MDKFGVPKKVNRKVIKAIYELNNQGSKNPNLSNICDLVEFAMKNNVPVANLQSLVRQSLQNLCKLGVIEKQGTSYFRIETDKNIKSCQPISSKPVNRNIFKKAIRKEKESTLNPNNRKRVVLSDEESIPENDPTSSIKRFRTSKTLSRKGQKVDLPKVRTPHMNYQSSCIGEIQQEWCSSSGNDSEDERNNNIQDFTSSIEQNPQTVTEIFESARVEVKAFDKLNQPVIDISNRKNNSQTQNHQFNENCDVQVRINKLDMLNEKVSQRIENKKSSDSIHYQTTNEQPEESIILDTEQQPHIVKIESNNGNINDGSTDQTIQIKNELINQDPETKSNHE